MHGLGWGGERSRAAVNHAGELRVSLWRGPNFARLRAMRACAGKPCGDATGRKLHFPASSWRQNYVARKPERDSPRLLTRLPPAGKPMKCGAAGFGCSGVLKAAGAAGFRAPVGVFRRPCGEVRKGTVSPDACVLCGEVVPVAGAGLGERNARVPPPPSSPPRGLATLLPSLAPRGWGGRREGREREREPPKACLPARLFRSRPARCLSEPFSVEGGWSSPPPRRCSLFPERPVTFRGLFKLRLLLGCGPPAQVIYSARFPSGPLYFRSSFRYSGANSERGWRTGKPGVLQPVGSQRVELDWATEQPALYLRCGFQYLAVAFQAKGTWSREATVVDGRARLSPVCAGRLNLLRVVSRIFSPQFLNPLGLSAE